MRCTRKAVPSNFISVRHVSVLSGFEENKTKNINYKALNDLPQEIVFF